VNLLFINSERPLAERNDKVMEFDVNSMVVRNKLSILIGEIFCLSKNVELKVKGAAPKGRLSDSITMSPLPMAKINIFEETFVPYKMKGFFVNSMSRIIPSSGSL
jgi:hypothetical protein